jgi:tryptophanyl-tRNA synthetase
MSIMSVITGKSMEAICEEYSGRGYGVFKDAVADAVIEELSPIQERYKKISADKAYLQEVMTGGAEKAAALAYRTMLKVRKKVGLAAFKL